MPNNGAYNNEAANAAARNIAPVGLTRLPIAASLSTEWLSHSQASRAPAPLLRFTDLISGPATGLGDGLGDGAIVTIWAQGIGDSQGTGKVYFTDFNGTKREAAHVYYWKRADGQLPSGPARLWYSHLMQEIAFSIPAGSVNGLGSITVETGGQTSNALPFTVRAGDFLFIDNSGNDAATGTFNDPLRTYNDGARALASAGTTIYFMDVDIYSAESPNFTTTAALYTNTGVQADESNHLFMAGYPGARASVYAKRCTGTYNSSTGLCYSKLALYSASHPEDENGQPGTELGNSPGPVCLAPSRYGRGVGNLCTDVNTYCSDGQGGAIEGGRDNVERFKIYCNEVADYSCYGASRLHHTTYLTIRDISGADPAYEAWEWDFNFIHGGKAKYGIHNYDEKSDHGTLTTPLNIKNNVIVEQAGAGISIGSGTGDGWVSDCNIENNLMIDVGGPADWNGLDPLTSDANKAGGVYLAGWLKDATVSCLDNLIYRYSEYLENDNPINALGALAVQNPGSGYPIVWSRNVAYSAYDFPFVGPDYDPPANAANLTGSDNCWHYTGQSPSFASVPSFDSSPVTADPQITFDGCIAIVAPTSPLKGKGASTGYDLYGVPRSTYQTIGPVEALS